MVDNVNRHKRSQIMAKIHSKNTKLEVYFRKVLWDSGLRHRMHYDIEGRPDLAFPSKKVAVFIDSCFWHGCSSHCRKPSSNKRYWTNKIERNILRDKEVKTVLTKRGWKCVRVWEHSIKQHPEKCVKNIRRILLS